MASAFAIRAGEDHVSVNWLEYFGARDGTGETTGGVGETTNAAVSRVRVTLT